MSTQRWIHCNLCNTLMANQESKFFHLSCLDVVCRSCMAKTNRGTCCPVCNNPINHFTEVGSTMSRKERMLYHCFPIGLYQISCQTLLFQQKHRQRLVQSILKARESMRRLDELELEIKKQIMQTKQRYENVRNYRRTLQENLRRSVSPGEGGTLCSSAHGMISQRRMSTCTPSAAMPKPLQPVRRNSVDAFNLVNSVKMSQKASTGNKTFGMVNSVKISQASSSNDSGIGMNSSSDTCGSGLNSFSASNNASLISPIEMDRIPKRRMSMAGSLIPLSSTPFKPPRRSSIDAFNKLLGGGSSCTGATPSMSLFGDSSATAITDFYNKNK